MGNASSPHTNDISVSSALAGGSRTTLCLTNIRTSPQNYRDKIKEKRLQLKGKPFKVHLSKPKFCNSKKIAFIKNADSNRKIEISTIACNSWTCPTCGPKKAIRLKYYLREIIQLNNLDRMLTFTLDPKKVPKKYFSEIEVGFNTIAINNTHAYITNRLNLFLLNIQRKYLKTQKVPLKYVWVIEFQQNGMAHIHMIINRFMPIRLLRYEWSRIGGGVQMEISKARSVIAVSNYVTDYIIKGLKNQYDSRTQKGGFKYNERRYSVSRSCTKPEKAKIISLNKLSEEDKNEYIKLLNLEEVYNTLLSD